MDMENPKKNSVGTQFFDENVKFLKIAEISS